MLNIVGTYHTSRICKNLRSLIIVFQLELHNNFLLIKIRSIWIKTPKLHFNLICSTLFSVFSSFLSSKSKSSCFNFEFFFHAFERNWLIGYITQGAKLHNFPLFHDDLPFLVGVHTSLGSICNNIVYFMINCISLLVAHT